MTATLTVADFILARIAEDEAMAKAATTGPWWYDPTKWNSIDHEESVFAGFHGADATTVASTGPGNDPQSMLDAVHIARHGPARVPAECAAKRSIVGLFSAGFDERGLPWGEGGYGEAYCEVLQHLAAVYASHPDYREEWSA